MSDASPPYSDRRPGDKYAGWALVMQFTSMLAFIGGGVVLYSQKQVQTQADVSVLAPQIADLRVEMRAGFANVQAQISILPDQRAAITSMRRDIDSLDVQERALDTRLGLVERGVDRLQLQASPGPPIRNSR